MNNNAIPVRVIKENINTWLKNHAIGRSASFPEGFIDSKDLEILKELVDRFNYKERLEEYRNNN